MTEPIYAQRYRTRRHLPAGRAEAAYAGRDAEGHPVVVTVVRPVDADVFLRTMGVVASVRHLDLAPVVDAGRDGPDCYVVGWDYGEVDAAAMVERGPLAAADAALIGASAAAGLAALHERGVVHGGVDPASLVRAEDGSVKLTGAGLAEAYPPPDLRPGHAARHGALPEPGGGLRARALAGLGRVPPRPRHLPAAHRSPRVRRRRWPRGRPGAAGRRGAAAAAAQPGGAAGVVADRDARARTRTPARAAPRRSSRPTSSACCARRRSSSRSRSRATEPGSGWWACSWSWPRPWRSPGRSARSTREAATSRCRTSPA